MSTNASASTAPASMSERVAKSARTRFAITAVLVALMLVPVAGLSLAAASGMDGGSLLAFGGVALAILGASVTWLVFFKRGIERAIAALEAPETIVWAYGAAVEADGAVGQQLHLGCSNGTLSKLPASGELVAECLEQLGARGVVIGYSRTHRKRFRESPARMAT